MNYQPILHAMLIIVSFGLIFIIAMCVEQYTLKKQNKETYDLKETLANVTSAGLYKTLDGIYIILFVGVMSAWIQQHGLGYHIPTTWWSVLLIFVIQDFFFYVAHLVAHKFRFAWVPHKIHHSSRHFNFGVALRQSLLAPIPFLGVFTLLWAPFAFIGFDIKVVAFIYELNLLFQFFIHTQTINKMPKWYEFIFNTPSHHRTHHGCADSQIDCNYAGVFIIWDRLFGTFKREEDVGPIIFGVKSRPINTNNVFVMIFEELFDLIKTIWKTKDLRHLFRHPDWKADTTQQSTK